MFFVFWFTNSIFFQWIWSNFFGFLNTKVKILELYLLFLPRIQNRFFYINFPLLFQILLLLFNGGLCWCCCLKNFYAFFIISDLIFFLKILKIFYKSLRRFYIFIVFGFLDLFIIFTDCLFHKLKLREPFRLFTFVCWEFYKMMELKWLIIIFHFESIYWSWNICGFIKFSIKLFVQKTIFTMIWIYQKSIMNKI